MRYDRQSQAGRLLEGDQEAVCLVFRWITSVLATTRYGGLRGEWPDLHQEIVTRVIHSLRRGRFQPSKDLRVYVQAVAHYTAQSTQQMQRERPAPAALPASWPDRGAGEGAMERLDARRATKVLLDHASDCCRELITIYFFEERGYGEIARRMGLPVGTVKSRLSRCLAQLAAPRDGRRDRRECAPCRTGASLGCQDRRCRVPSA